jgi:hypothetical protein
MEYLKRTIAIAPENVTVYSYASLPSEKTIRMLTLYPGEKDHPLQGALEVVNIDSLGFYEPISYVWGKDPTRSHKIICDGQELSLTSSLYHALSRLRLPDRPRRLWADQICINQDDKDERSQQVQFMNSIYKCANHVLVWLGTDMENMAKPAFALVRQLSETFSDEEKLARFRSDHTDSLAERSSEEWKALMALAGLPWVSRITTL